MMESIFNADYYMRCKNEEAFEEGEAKGIAVGEARGKKAGRIEERRNMAVEFLKAGTPIEVISKVTGFEPEYIKSLC